MKSENNDLKEEETRQKESSRAARPKDDDSEDGRKRKKKKRHRKRRHESSSSSDESSSSSSEERRRRRKEKKRKRRKHKKKRSKKRSDDSSDSSSSNDDDSTTTRQVSTTTNNKLSAKLAARGETLEEYQERKNARRAAKLEVEFGYTPEDNPFHDPNLAETFVWNKKQQTSSSSSTTKKKNAVEEIKKVRARRAMKEEERAEVDRLRQEEARMKEQENYDEWMRKEEEFHLLQQRQRSAIRLVEGREKPIDVLAKNLLLFGLSDEETTNHAAIKYKERYNALNELETMEAELEEPHVFLKVLKLEELQELLEDIEAFRTLERESSSGTRATEESSVILRYWNALHLVTQDEIEYLQSGGAEGRHAKVVEDILKLFEGQSEAALFQMKNEIVGKLRGSGGMEDVEYWKTVLSQLNVYLAKKELSHLHEKMLVRQLERLEKKKEQLKAKGIDQEAEKEKIEAEKAASSMVPKNVNADIGDLENELGLDDEFELANTGYSWQDKWRPRKPRYFNRVKTGYDWNKYNQTHYDHDNPPPKTVQGYKFNIFYPELVDKTKTPQFFIEPADSPEFCILRFHAGPPYEDIAFKIINREWNRSRKRGFRSTFERGVLSLYFNFTTHWYRR